MTEPAAQPPPARPGVFLCVVGPHEVPADKKAALGMCWTHYARSRRPAGVPSQRTGPGDPRTHTLEVLTAAYGRIHEAEAEADRTLTALRGYAIGAYRGGLSYAQISELAGRAPMTVQSWIPPEIRRSLAQPIWGGERASEKVVDSWRPLLTVAASQTDVAQERAREVRAQFREQVADATRDGNPGRVGVRRIAGHLEIPLSTVQSWLVPRQKGEQRGRFRCTGIKPDGARCGNVPRVGKRTCWNHRAQEAA